MTRFPFNKVGFVAVLAFGIAGDLLLRNVGPLGINYSIWATAIAGVALVCPPSDASLGVRDRVPLVAAIVFAVLYTWRDADPLKALLVAIISGSVVLSAAGAVGRSPRTALVWDYVIDHFNFFVRTLGVPLTLFERKPPPIARPQPSSPLAKGVLRGVLIAVPLLWLFGQLLVSADAAFSRAMGWLFDVISIDPEELASHVALSAFCAWTALAAWALCLTTVVKPPFSRNDANRPFVTGIIEVNVVLGLVTVLFMAFVLLQGEYLRNIYQHPIDLTAKNISDYARRGFFQLAWVASIALALIVICTRALSAAGPTGKRIYKIVAAVMILMVLGIIASALHRMSFYIGAFGLTQLRLFTASFMVWMAVVFIWLYVCVYRERIRSFAWGMLLSGYAATFVLVALNPDARIAAVNMDRAQEGKMVPALSTTERRPAGSNELDTQYIGELGADAIPVIINRLDAMSPAVQSTLRTFLANRKKQYEERSPRTWTVGLHNARAALAKINLPPPNPAPSSPDGVN